MVELFQLLQARAAPLTDQALSDDRGEEDVENSVAPALTSVSYSLGGRGGGGGDNNIILPFIELEISSIYNPFQLTWNIKRNSKSYDVLTTFIV